MKRQTRAGNAAAGHAWDDGVSAAQNVRCTNCASQRREQHTERLKALAEERGGRLLSASYVDAATALQWECAFGHSWDAQPRLPHDDGVPSAGAGACTTRRHRIAKKKRWHATASDRQSDTNDECESAISVARHPRKLF